MPLQHCQQRNSALIVGPGRKSGVVRRIFVERAVRGRGASNRAASVRRIDSAIPRHSVLYRIEEWKRDSVLEMIGVNPDDTRIQIEDHRR